ncbi:MAG TPA: Ppx/GppA phosphatase family protein [Solirubrobacteraceae bacterium]|jgi:exopolyphosphatase/guanosine-5'-triphosphate,3'-diphosphate pyrophosphatase
MRVAIVDIGTNSTRLLIADVDRETGAVRERARHSQVTRLGQGVDSTGALSQDAVARVMETLEKYVSEIDEHGCEANLAVCTSAVRDAKNGGDFLARVRDKGLDARILAGEEEAQLTFLGAMSGREKEDETDDPSESRANGERSDSTVGRKDRSGRGADEPTVVIDVGGGSTEFIVGSGREAGFHVSLHAGVVRMSERHIHSDPPRPQELQELARDVRTVFLDGLPPQERAPVTRGIAVAGTATSAAAITQELDPYDPARVHGYELQLATVEMLLARLADMDEAERREVVGLHPDRAPTIVAGMILLGEALRAFELEQVEVSEHDILFGGALRLAGLG